MSVSMLAEHLWQSTWFALAAAMLALLLRRDAARFRYWIWLAASLKFLVPFAALTWIGSRFIVQVHDESALLPVVQHIAAPLATATVSIEPLDRSLQQFLIAAWLFGSAALLMRWLVNWLRMRAIVRASVPCDIAAPMVVRCSDRIDEPGVVGIREPVLLMPATLVSQLTPAQLDDVIAHEAWHVRRRDNLAASLHTLVEALFWFHPLVWWIGARLVAEREHACDEGAIDEGSEPAAYAEAILRVCRHSVESRLMWVAGAGAGDLTARIRAIMNRAQEAPRCLACRGVIAAALLACIALPVAAGVHVIATSNIAPAAGTRLLRLSDAASPSFIVTEQDYVYARNVSLRELIGHVYLVNARQVAGDRRWLDRGRYDIELRVSQGSAGDAQQLVSELLRQQFNVELIVR
jgi:beta-lactamase regulating signal transducer with metallopeptidase domain